MPLELSWNKLRFKIRRLGGVKVRKMTRAKALGNKPVLRDDGTLEIEWWREYPGTRRERIHRIILSAEEFDII